MRLSKKEIGMIVSVSFLFFPLIRGRGLLFWDCYVISKQSEFWDWDGFRQFIFLSLKKIFSRNYSPGFFFGKIREKVFLGSPNLGPPKSKGTPSLPPEKRITEQTSTP